MATLQELIDSILGPRVTTTLPEEVQKGLGQLPTSSGMSDTARQLRRPNQGTGSPVIKRGEPRQFKPNLPKVFQETLEEGRKKLGGFEFSPERIALLRQAIKKPVTLPDGRRVFVEDTAMSEFEGADTPSPFGRFRPVTEPAQSEFVNATSPLPTPGNLPGSDENEELFADNVALSLLQDLPANPAARAANQAKVDAAKGLAYGANTAKAQNQEGLISQAADTISGLLGNIDFQGLFRVLARPEFVAPMGPGRSPLTNFVRAAAADRQSQAALRAARQEAGLEAFKAETDRLKALMPDPSKMPKLTAEANKLYDSMAAAENTARLGKQIQESLSSSFMVSGGPGLAAEGFRAIAAMFGFDPGEMEQDEVKKRVAALKKEILQSRAFGREANKQELEILNRLVQEPDPFTSRTQILNSIKSLTESAERSRFNVAARLKAFGLPTEFNATKPEGPGFTRNN